MNYSYHICSLLMAVGIFTSCEDARLDSGSYGSIQNVNENSYWTLVNKYDFIKQYEDKSTNPIFRVGAGIMAGGYIGNTILNRVVNENFSEMTAGYEMKHGPVVKANGELNFSVVDRFITKAKEGGLGVFGHTLVWHSNQNAAYLNSLIAPVIIPGDGGPTLGDNMYANGDFEGSENKWVTNGSNTLTLDISADGEGFEGVGKALKVTNSRILTNPYDSQIWYRYDTRLAVGDQYEFSMNVRANKACEIGSQWHGDTYQYTGGGIGNMSLTTQWQLVKKTITVTTSSPIGALVFDLGKVDATIYIDNISMRRVETSGATLEPNIISDSDFERGSLSTAWGTQGGGTTATLTADGEGAGGKGWALCVNNPTVRTNPYDAQIYYRFEPWLKKGDEYQLSMDVRADVETTFGSQIHEGIGAYAGGFIPDVKVTKEWKTVKATFTVPKDFGGMVFDIGKTATKFYFDNVSVRRIDPYGGAEVIEKTPEEKKALIEGAMTKFITEMVTRCKNYIHAWDVVNEPMDDGSPYQLKTGDGKKLGDDEFYWQDYLGKNYAVTAFKLARQYGNPDDKLFINDYNLEYNIDKCKGIIEYVKYLEQNGAEIDGIGTQMHINVKTNRDKIEEMFRLLAATGKLIRVSELDVSMGNSVEMADYQEQADMYRFVVESYFKYIPVNQRYGITVWGLNDGDPYWLTTQQACLWDRNYQRKLSYKAFCDGLAGKELYVKKD